MNTSMPPQKKARRTFPPPSATARKTSSYNEAAVLSSREYDLHKRSEAFSKKINAFYKEFPEMERIIPRETVHKERTDAIQKYKEDIEAKERYHVNEMNSPLYALPDEVLQKCISFIGEGHYALVALVAKKLYNAHEEEYGIDRSYTSYDIATSTVETAKYCNEEFCNSIVEKDKLFTAAAVKGNIDILQYSVESGYDLFPFICNEKNNKILDTRKIAARSNLHVLKYLKDQYDSYTWLQKYCQTAIEHGRLEILKWLQSIGCLTERNVFGEEVDFCLTAIDSGHLDVLKFLHSLGFEECHQCISTAIESKSIAMIEYCLDRGHEESSFHDFNKALAKAKSMELYRFFHSRDYEFTIDVFHESCIRNGVHYNEFYYIVDDLEILKFLRSVGVEWAEDIMPTIVCKGNLEIIQYAFEDGCPWSTTGDSEYYELMLPSNGNYDVKKLKYLIDNGCSFDYDSSSPRSSNILEACCLLRDLSALECLVGKYSRFDNSLLKRLLFNYKWYYTSGIYKDKPWLEGIKFVFEKGKDIARFDTIESIIDALPNMELVKHLRECLHLPWTFKDQNKYVLLSKIACHHGIEGVQWALDNGLGYDNPSLKCYNETSDDTNEVCKLITERGFVFPSRLEKSEVIEKAFMECCRHPNEENRNCLALLRKIPVLSVNA